MVITLCIACGILWKRMNNLQVTLFLSQSVHSIFDVPNRKNIPFNKQDVIHFPGNQEKIDMSETIADIISLAEPMKPICSVNCLGLCPYCGKNLNQSSCDCKPEKDTSPWDVLNKIKSEKN